MQPSNGILKPNKKLMQLTMPKTRSKKWHVALKVSVVLMLLACIITPIVRHYFVYWVNLSTHSSPEDPYVVINGFAETEEEYDPFIQDMRASWAGILEELDEQYGLDAVEVVQTIYSVESYYSEPQPQDLAKYLISDVIYFNNEEDTRNGLISLGNYYAEQGYATYLPEIFYPHQKFYPEEGITDEENTELEKEFTVEPIEGFIIWKGPEDMNLTVGTQAQTNEAKTYGEAGANIWAFINDEDNSIRVEYQAYNFPLSSLPKFEGNIKLLDMDRANPRFNMMDGTMDYDMCPLKPSTSTSGGWDPKYGCLDD